MLFCVSHRGGLTNGQQGAAEQSREAQTKKEKPKPAQHVSSFSAATSKSGAGKKPG
jgi:hypothetical protein